MKDNRGLTLVELLITVTILALVIAGAASFMLAGSQSFAKGSADSNVQGEAELAVNQIEDLIIDVNGGVDFTDDTDASTLTMYHVEADNSGVTVNKKRTVKWDKSDKNIYSGEWIVDKDGSGVYVETSTVYANQLLAENVTDFNVDLSDKYIETAKDGTDIEIVRSVVIRVDCLDGTGKSTYATTPTITLRNRLLISSNPDEIFNHTPTPDDSLLLYISSTGMEGAVPIRDRVTTVERGKVYNIFAMVSVGTNVNSLCNFTVEGETSGHLSTITPEGVHIALDVKDSEPNNYLKITATYKTNSAKTVSGWVKVIGGESKSLDDVDIHTKNWTLEPYFTQHTKTTNFTAEEIAELQYTWTVTGCEAMDEYPRNGLDLKLRIHPVDENYGKVFTIRVEVYSPTTNQTVWDEVKYFCNKAGSDPRLERGKASDGKGGHGDVQNWWDNKGYYPKDYEFEYYFTDETGVKEIKVSDDIYNCIIITPSFNRYTLAFSENLPPEYAYYIKVKVYYYTHEETTGVWDPENGYHEVITKPSERFLEYECLHYIPPVSLWGGNVSIPKNRKVDENGNSFELGVLSSGFQFHYETEGYYELSWANNDPEVYQYDIVELNGTIPGDITVTPKIVQTECEGDNYIYARCKFEVDIPGDDYSRYKEIDLDSMVILVSMKDHPSINTKVYVTFTE